MFALQASAIKCAVFGLLVLAQAEERTSAKPTYTVNEKKGVACESGISVNDATECQSAAGHLGLQWKYEAFNTHSWTSRYVSGCLVGWNGKTVYFNNHGKMGTNGWTKNSDYYANKDAKQYQAGNVICRAEYRSCETVDCADVTGCEEYAHGSTWSESSCASDEEGYTAKGSKTYMCHDGSVQMLKETCSKNNAVHITDGMYCTDEHKIRSRGLTKQECAFKTLYDPMCNFNNFFAFAADFGGCYCGTTACKDRTGSTNYDLYRAKCNLKAMLDVGFKIGHRVEGNFQGKGSWYAGVISGMDKDTCTYSIAYDDGDKESGARVPGDHLRVEHCGGTFKVGEKVGLKWEKSGKWSWGRIRKCKYLKPKQEQLDMTMNYGRRRLGMTDEEVAELDAPKVAERKRRQHTLVENFEQKVIVKGSGKNQDWLYFSEFDDGDTAWLQESSIRSASNQEWHVQLARCSDSSYYNRNERPCKKCGGKWVKPFLFVGSWECHCNSGAGGWEGSVKRGIKINQMDWAKQDGGVCVRK